MRPDVTITPRPPARFEFADGRLAEIATERWELERWDGEPDPPDLARTWARKPRFAVSRRRSCAELAIVNHLQRDGWHGVWVNAFERSLRTEWFPAPAFPTLAAAGAPPWASAIFGRLLEANGGALSGFFDVFALAPAQRGQVLRSQDRQRPEPRHPAAVPGTGAGLPPAQAVHDHPDPVTGPRAAASRGRIPGSLAR